MQLVLQLDIPVAWHVVLVYRHLRCFALHNHFVSLVVQLVFPPSRAVRRYLHIWLFTVLRYPVDGTSLNHRCSCCVGVEFTDCIFEVVTCTHGEVFLFRCVVAHFSTPQLVWCFKWIQKHNCSGFTRTDTAFADFQPLLTVGWSYHFCVHFRCVFLLMVNCVTFSSLGQQWHARHLHQR